MSKLDEATQRLTAGDADALSVTTGIDGDDGDARPAAARKPAAKPTGESSAASSLGLRLSGIEDASIRLETLDGETHESQMSPTHSGTFFSNFVDTHRPEDYVAVDEKFWIVREHQDDGPYDLETLNTMILASTLKSVDTLRAVATGETCLTVQVGQLREACQSLVSSAPAGREASIGLANDASVRLATPLATRGTRPAPRPEPGAPPSKSLGTLVLVMLVLAAFGAAGWWLTQGSPV